MRNRAITADRALGTAPTWLYLCWAALVVALPSAGPAGSAPVAMVLALASGVGALIYGMRRNAAPGRRGPWLLLLMSLVLLASAMLLRQAAPLFEGVHPSFFLIALDVLVLPAMTAMGIGYAAMLRRRRAGEDDPARVDALLVGLAAAFLAWTFVIAPSLDRGGLTVPQMITSCFPVIDVVLLVLVAQLALAGGARQPALWLLILGAGVMFVGDLLFMLSFGGLVAIPPGLPDTLFLGTFLLVGGAALHPSMRTLTEPQQVEVANLGVRRIGLIAALVVSPAIITSLVPTGAFVNSVVRAALCGLLILTVFGRVVRSNNSRARAESMARRRATHDSLTDLPNREYLTETVGQWSAEAKPGHEISLLFLDLDHFKMVNDHWGHPVGDELLCRVAERLHEQVRETDLVCRIGGDEFVIAFVEPAPSRHAELLADRMLAEFARPFALSVGSVVTSASIGVVSAPCGSPALDLIRDGDTAVYRAKDRGRNAYVVFDKSLRVQVETRMSLEQALRGALANDELSVHFQPIIDLETGDLDGFEALMRWTHPVLGNVSPLDFIPVAEETGMVVEYGEWLLRESVARLARWSAVRAPDARPLHVSVNVSVRQLRDESLVGTVQDVLAETGLDPSCLWLEITESGVMEHLDTALKALNELRRLGVVLCIDDFGTGYSSLSYLNLLPVEIVKVDRSFVASVGENGTNESIVRAVLAMTRAMGLRVVAEGVETQTQRDWLRAQGCDLAQGWLYGKAQPADEAEVLVVCPPRVAEPAA